MIEIKGNEFRLAGNGYQYIFCNAGGKLQHIYYGADLGGFYSNCPSNNGAQYEEPKEFSEFGRGDFRVPAIVVRTGESLTTDFRYEGHEILTKKPSIGMPAVRGEYETLAVIFRDKRLGLKLTLYYTPYEDALVRSALLENESGESVVLDKMSSACFELPRGSYEYLDLFGRPCEECVYEREKVSGGIKKISSVGGRTSHRANNFLAVMQDGADEDTGEVYGFNLIYSGNFNIELDRDAYSRVRVIIGENILYGGIELCAGEKYYTPEAVSVYSAEGIGEMSRRFHRLYRKHLINPRFADKIRPIVINSWESIVFEVGESKLMEFIDGAKGLGIDMVVLDDGWFGKRDNDRCSLGDWYVDKNKLPRGLDPIIEHCHKSGMRFGIWFEPEAISPDSDLYRAHPDWAIHTEGTTGVQIRSQLVLDMSKKEVVDYIFESMKKILESHKIDYVKWDMNRDLTDVPNAKKYREYVFGLYDLYDRLTKTFPDILIEGCASGGGRFDGGILYYSPMIWTSDITDAWWRAKIQYTTSLCYPLQAMSNHVSRNKQIGKVIKFETRGRVAKMGCLGYELPIGNEPEEHREMTKKQIEDYKKDADVILTGDLYRLRNPYTDGAFSEMVVSEDKSRAILVYVREKGVYQTREKKLLLRGLDADATYLIEETGALCTGRQLMLGGFDPAIGRGDYASMEYHFTRQ